MRDYVPEAETIHHTVDPVSFPPAIEKLLLIALALVLLVPCFWQSHLQAGDFSSHIYNAWLTLEAEKGSVTGLETHWQWTNTLADLFLPRLLQWTGRAATERIASGIAVELFFWGAFCLVARACGRRPWMIAPVLVMLAWGTIFQLGFLNFYLSTGISLWLVSTLWELTRARIAAAVVLAALALLAHALPFAGAFFAIAYIHAHRKIDSRLHVALLVAGVLILALAAGLAAARYQVHWSWDQVLFEDGLLSALGAGQVWPYGSKYALVAGATVVLWFLLLLRRVDRGGALADPLIHLWILSVAAVALFPTSVQIPGYGLPLEFIPVRLSLFVSVLLCGAVSSSRGSLALLRGALVIAVGYFVCVYLDTKEFSRVEENVTSLVSKLPPGQRVVATMKDRQTRFNPLAHVASAACIERCFDYGNYEAPSGMFRLRVVGPTVALPSDIRVVTELEDKPHIVTAGEAPLYSVCPNAPAAATPETASLTLKKLAAGQSTCHFDLAVSSQIF